jgi:glycosyltransferase involved in cell wall biosynthesis
VAVISRNQGEFLAQAVESVLAQTYPVREILVVDDASQDETPDVAADYAGRRVRYLWVDHRHPMLARRAATPRRRPPWRG